MTPVKPKFINGEVLYDRKASAIYAINTLLNKSGSFRVVALNYCFGNGKTSLISKLDQFYPLADVEESICNKSEFIKLKEAVYIYVAFNSKDLTHSRLKFITSIDSSPDELKSLANLIVAENISRALNQSIINADFRFHDLTSIHEIIDYLKIKNINSTIFFLLRRGGNL